jgi:ribosomal protein L40E
VSAAPNIAVPSGEMSICPNCGARVSPGARFCSRCGVPQRLPGASASRAVAQEPVDQWELCEIDWWRGYVSSEFYATGVGADGMEYEVARSRGFRWRRQEPPPADHERARAAHERLCERLTKAGWEPIGAGRAWYARRFRRHATGLRVLAGELVPAEAEDSAEA